MAIEKYEAKRIRASLLNNPVAPGAYSHFINVGTNNILDILEDNYFRDELPQGISCFKYLQGAYGGGKTQFINSLSARAWQNNIVTSIANVGIDCPFNSPLAIYQSVVSNFAPPPELGKEPDDSRGIEVLIRHYIQKQLRMNGVEGGRSVPPEIRQIVEQPFKDTFFGARDPQTAIAIQQLGLMILDYESGGSINNELISWIRGDAIRSKYLRDLGLHGPARDDNAFNRLRTIIAFMTKRMGMKGFFIAFDEGTRTVSFRRGSVKQKQAIENLLTMINEAAAGQFPGVMFLYAATPDFRNEVIRNYPALNDRIGDISFQPGSPMVPFIDLDSLDTDTIVREIGKRLLEVFAIAQELSWDMSIQQNNIEYLLEAEKTTYGIGSEIRRAFVYHFCILLNTQGSSQRQISPEEAVNFVQNHAIPNIGEN